MSQYIIIGGDGKEYGPVSTEEVRDWVKAGRANGETRIKPVGAEDWTRLAELPEFGGVSGGDSTAESAASLPPTGGGGLDPALPSDLLTRDYSVWSAGCFERGWAVLSANLGATIGTTAIFMVMIGVLIALMMIPFIGLLFSLLWIVINVPVMSGFIYYFIKQNRGQKAEIADIFSGFTRGFGNLLLLGLTQFALIIVSMIPGIILVGLSIGGLVIEAIRTGANPDFSGANILMAVAGYGLMILPSIYLNIAWMYAAPLAIDRQLGFWQAMNTSRKVVNKHWFQMFFFLMVWVIIAELGVIACCVGLIFTVPLGLAIHVAGYEHLFGERGESANVASPNPPAPPQI
jgi:uncharacterized membrane protein